MAQLRRIVSGGQTGVDLAAFDAALACGLACGGWVPKGRLNEAGVIPAKYPGLRETPSSDPAKRTVWNVRDSDATLIVTRGPLAGGSLLTAEEARRLGKPLLYIDLHRTGTDEAVRRAHEWLASLEGCETLNVAGPRASEDPGIYQAAKSVLLALFHTSRPPRDEKVS